MKVSAVSALALAPTLAMAQNATFINGLVSALTSANLTQLVSVAATINSTSTGQSLLADISNGGPFVIFAPSNDACKS